MHQLTFETALIKNNSTIIVGLSGGPDSVCLLHMLSTLKEQHNLMLIAAHLNHEWRDTAHLDVTLCQTLCDQLNIPLIVGKASDFHHQTRKSGSKEDIGRQLRHLFFNHILSSHPNAYIALAHHADDQRETFFMRIIRGTTLTGLCCMKNKNGRYIRPLLRNDKATILTYLKTNNLPFIIDTTNESQVFLRNKIRTQLLPLMQQIDHRSKDHIITLIDHLQEAEQYLEQETVTYSNTLATSEGLDIKRWQLLPFFMQKRVLLHWIFNQHGLGHTTLSKQFIEEILRFLHSERGGKHELTPSWSLIKKQHKATIVPRTAF